MSYIKDYENEDYPDRRVNRLSPEPKPGAVFWLIWNPAHHSPPTFRFCTRVDAENVAESMARTHKAKFYVLKAESMFEIPEIPIKKLVLK